MGTGTCTLEGTVGTGTCIKYIRGNCRYMYMYIVH